MKHFAYIRMADHFATASSFQAPPMLIWTWNPPQPLVMLNLQFISDSSRLIYWYWLRALDPFQEETSLSDKLADIRDVWPNDDSAFTASSATSLNGLKSTRHLRLGTYIRPIFLDSIEPRHIR